MDELYNNLANYYDGIYSEKDYEEDSKKIKKILKKYKETKGVKLLDVACGTGEHIKHLRKGFDCTGIDLNQGILDRAREKIEDVDFHQGNMIDFDLNEEFDVLTCLFSSIGYVKTRENLEKTMKSFSKHLKKGGVAIVEPWFGGGQFKDGYIDMGEFEKGNVKIARIGYSEKNGDQSKTEMHYLIGEKGKGVMYKKEEHELGLFSDEDIKEAMKKAGMKPKKVEGDLELNRRTFVGIKQ